MPASRSAHRQPVPGNAHEPRLEARGAAGVDDEPVGGRGHPGVVAQLSPARSAPRPARRWPRDRGEHRLPASSSRRAVVMRGGAAASWKASATSSRPGAHAFGEAGQRALLHRHLESGHARAGRRSPPGPRPASALGKAPTRSCAARRRQRGHLDPSEPEARGDRVGVLEQQPAGVRGQRAAAAADEQLRPELALERRDLLGDRRLAERQCLRRAGERAVWATARKVSSRRASSIRSAYRYTTKIIGDYGRRSPPCDP